MYLVSPKDPVGQSRNSVVDIAGAVFSGLTLAKTRRIKSNQNEIIDVIGDLKSNMEKLQFQQAVTNLSIEISDAIASAERQSLNCTLLNGLGQISKQLEDLSQTDNQVLAELRNQRIIREYEGMYFGIIDMMNDELDYVIEIMPLFPEYACLLVAELKAINRKYKLNLGKFQQMEFLKYERAKEFYKKFDATENQMAKIKNKSSFKELKSAFKSNAHTLSEIQKLKQERTNIRKEIRKSKQVISTREKASKKNKQKNGSIFRLQKNIESSEMKLRLNEKRIQTINEELSRLKPSQELREAHKKLTRILDETGKIEENIQEEQSGFKFGRKKRESQRRVEELEGELKSKGKEFSDSYDKCKEICEVTGFELNGELLEKIIRNKTNQSLFENLNKEKKELSNKHKNDKKEHRKLTTELKKIDRENLSSEKDSKKRRSQMEKLESRIDKINYSIDQLKKDSLETMESHLLKIPDTVILNDKIMRMLMETTKI